MFIAYVCKFKIAKIRPFLNRLENVISVPGPSNIAKTELYLVSETKYLCWDPFRVKTLVALESLQDVLLKF